MRTLSPSSNEEMIAVFLQGELDSPRFGDVIETALHSRGLSRSLIERPNLSDEAENAQRSSILFEYRPWLASADLLKGWPPKAKWQWVELARKDIENLRYVTYSYWDELSNGTHSVGDGASSVRSGKVVFDVPHDNFWKVAHRVDAREDIPPMIILSNSKGQPHIVIEGHVRATSYLLAEHPPKTLRALLGSVEP